MSNKKIIEQMHGVEITPKTFCGTLVEHADDIEYIASVVIWKNGTCKVFSTAMENQHMAWMRWCFDQDFRPDPT